MIFLTVFLDLLGFGIVIPILPLYAKEMHASDGKIGILLAVYSAAQLVFAPIWGRVSDRFGRRPVLLVSILGSCFSQLGYALAPSFWWLVVARGFAGICGANIAAAQAYIADVTDEKSRAAGMGMLGAAFGLGFVFGPAAGGLLSKLGDAVPFYVASALSGVNFLLALVILIEPRGAGERSASRVLSWSGLVRTLSSPRLAVLMLVYLVITFGFANLEATFTLYLSRRFHYERSGASYLYAYVGVIMIIVQGVLLRRIVARVGERALVVGGTLLMGTGMLLIYLSMHLPLLFLALTAVSVGNAINTPSLTSLISRSASGAEQGGVLGVSQSLGALARILGPIFGTWALAFGVGVPYAAAAGVMAVACVIALAAIRQPPSGNAVIAVGE